MSTVFALAAQHRPTDMSLTRTAHTLISQWSLVNITSHMTHVVFLPILALGSHVTALCFLLPITVPTRLQAIPHRFVNRVSIRVRTLRS